MREWTLGERIALWMLFLGWNHRTSNFVSGSLIRQAARNLNRTEDSCESELWKMFRCNPDGPAYWNLAGRLEVKAPTVLHGPDFLPVEDYVITTSNKSGVPITRIAELLGREAPECLKRLHKLQGKDRPNFGFIKE